MPMVRKEFREIRRDPVTLWIAAVVPLVFLLLFGYALRIDFANTPMAVLDLDGSRQSAELVETFTNTGDFAVHRRPATEREVRRLLDAGDVRLALVIPRGFGREREAGRPVAVQTIIDGSTVATAVVLRNEAEAVTLAYAMRAGRRAAGGGPGGTPGSGPLPLGPTLEARVWYNPALRSATFIMPGLYAVILMAFPPLLTALAIVREKESGSVEQIYVSPLRPWEFIAGKMIPYVAIAFAEMASVVALGRLWFDVPFRGSALLLALASAIYVFCTVGIGLVVSTVTRSQVVAVMLALVVTVMPSFLFSGFLFPIAGMPRPVQWYTFMFPARYFNVISRGLFLKGTGLAELWPQFAVLVLYTLAVFAVASLRFRKKVA